MGMDEFSEATQGGAVFENTGDNAIFIKAIKRAVGMGVNTANLDEVVIFLEKEIDGYRDKIERLEAYIDGKVALIASLEDTIEKVRAVPNAARKAVGLEPITQLEAVQENIVTEIIKALGDNGYNTITINCYKCNESEV